MTDQTPDTKARVAAAAELLHAGRKDAPIESPPAELEPRDFAEAWAVHLAVVGKLGPIAAWKVGAPTPEAEPSCGIITADTLLNGPRRIAAETLRIWALEAEIAVTLGKDLGPRAEPYSEDEVLAAVGSWHAAIEVLDSAFAQWPDAPTLWKVADRQNHGLLVIGPPHARPAAPLATHPVVLSIDHEPVFERSGGNTGGDPTRLLVWLANHRRGTDRPLLKGDVVTTGSTTPFLKGKPGQTVTVEFPGFASVELIIAAAARGAPEGGQDGGG